MTQQPPDMGGVSEKEFLSRLRGRMKADGPKDPHPGSSVWPEGHEENVSFEEKAQMFTSALEALGGRVLRAVDVAQAYALVSTELAASKAGRVLLAGGDWSGLEAELKAAGIGADRWDELDFSIGSSDRALESVNAWDAGIGWADYAVASLGSIALLPDKNQARTVSLVPPRYVSLIRRDMLMYSRRTVLEHVSGRFRSTGTNGGLVFVTGPSRSADIEMDLSVGVHGPGEVWAVLIEE